MWSLFLCSFTCVCVMTVPACVSAVTKETVVGVAGRKVTLPCRTEAAGSDGVSVCWGRGEPSLFSCHNTVINAAGHAPSYRKSFRYSLSLSSSLSISLSRPSDSGLYHCRVQLAGLFNDQTFTVHLIVITSRSVHSDSTTQISHVSYHSDSRTLKAPHNATGSTTGSDVTGPQVALVQSFQTVSRLQMFVGNTVRASFILFIPALLLTTALRVWRANRRAETNRRMNQSEEEDVWE